MIHQILIAIACLMGAAGVVLAAAAAHSRPDAGLDSAGQMLLFHAAAVIAATTAAAFGVIARPLGSIGAAALVLGASLFAGDLALRAYTGHRLFPMAAPAGGLVLIAGWLVLVVAALAALGQRS
jgi:uncharacterized membrane protein YgdD (TMEM256/DUF423 family)